MEKQSNSRLKIGMAGLALSLILSGAVAVSYFLTDSGETKNEELIVNTGQGGAQLIFSDGSDGMQAKALAVNESVSKEVKIYNDGTRAYTTNLNWKDLRNTYLAKSLSYKVQYKTSETGDWIDIQGVSTNVPRTLVEAEITLLKDIEIPAKATYFYKITITLENTDENQESDKTAILTTKFSIGDYSAAGWVPKAIKAIKNNQTPKGINSITPTFANAATTDEGVFAMEDDYGTSYYYRGAVTNNYVKFGGFYWRIIRINGDGSLRMIYDGTSYHANGESNADRYTKIGQPFNAKASDAKYVGYMFGGTSKDAASTSAKDAQTNTYDSDIKTVVDEWYENNILTNVANSNENISKYLADVIFCNDRTLPAEGEIWHISQATQANLGWGKNHVTPYGARIRFVTTNAEANPNSVPTFKCSDNLTTGNKNNDRFTVSDTEKGNGDLTYPIGLLTADEMVAAGSGKYNTSTSSYYLFKGANSLIWSHSPSSMSNQGAYVYYIGYIGRLYTSNVSNTDGAVAPVINLKAEYAQQLIGTGVKDDEYRLEGVN